MELTPHSTSGTPPDSHASGSEGEPDATLIRHDELRDDLRDAVAIPAYRKFCGDNGLVIQNGDTQSHVEATNLFNDLKPHYSEFRGHIVHFRFGSDGCVERTVTPMAEFLAQVAHDTARLHQLEDRFKIATGLLVLSLGIIIAIVIGRLTKGAFPDWLLAMVLLVVADRAWRWRFVTRPEALKARKRAGLEARLEQLRQRLVRTQLENQIKRFGLAEAAIPKLADAITEYILMESGDRENRWLILYDINNLMMSASHPGAEVRANQLDDPKQLRGHLGSSLDLPAQTLARELPNRLKTWLKAEPLPNHPDRPAWAEQGRDLLNQTRLNS